MESDVVHTPALPHRSHKSSISSVSMPQPTFFAHSEITEYRNLPKVPFVPRNSVNVHFCNDSCRTTFDRVAADDYVDGGDHRFCSDAEGCKSKISINAIHSNKIPVSSSTNVLPIRALPSAHPVRFIGGRRFKTISARVLAVRRSIGKQFSDKIVSVPCEPISRKTVAGYLNDPLLELETSVVRETNSNSVDSTLNSTAPVHTLDEHASRDKQKSTTNGQANLRLENEAFPDQFVQPEPPSTQSTQFCDSQSMDQSKDQVAPESDEAAEDSVLSDGTRGLDPFDPRRSSVVKAPCRVNSLVHDAVWDSGASVNLMSYSLWLRLSRARNAPVGRKAIKPLMNVNDLTLTGFTSDKITPSGGCYARVQVGKATATIPFVVLPPAFREIDLLLGRSGMSDLGVTPNLVTNMLDIYDKSSKTKTESLPLNDLDELGDNVCILRTTREIRMLPTYAKRISLSPKDPIPEGHGYIDSVVDPSLQEDLRLPSIIPMVGPSNKIAANCFIYNETDRYMIIPPSTPIAYIMINKQGDEKVSSEMTDILFRGEEYVRDHPDETVPSMVLGVRADASMDMPNKVFVADIDQPEKNLSFVSQRPRTEVCDPEAFEDIFPNYVEEDLTPEQRLEQVTFGPAAQPKLKEFRELVLEFSDTFAANPNVPGLMGDIYHKIRTVPGARFPRAKLRSVSVEKHHAMRDEVKRLLKYGIIQNSNADNASNVVMVRRPNSTKWRMAIDYSWTINPHVVPDGFPIPGIRDILDHVSKANMLSALDGCSGYYQMPLHPDDRYKTSFRTWEGQYEFIVTPFGLKNAPASFQRAMNKMFADFLWTFVVVYLDDVIIFSDSIEEHLRDLRMVLEKCRDHNFHLKATKCHIGYNRVAILGFVAGSGTISSDPSKTHAVRNFPEINSVKKLRSFLGVTGHYRRFIKMFSRKAKPLFDLLKKDAPWVWGEEQEKAVAILKQAMCSTPVLASPDPKREFIVETDGSKEGISGILAQRDSVTKLIHPCAYFDRTLRGSEPRYSAHELEGLAIRETYHRFRHYLLPNKSTLITDCEALTKLTKGNTYKNHRVRLWSQFLDQFQIETLHRAGKLNAAADGFSRVPAAEFVDAPEILRLPKNLSSGVLVSYVTCRPELLEVVGAHSEVLAVLSGSTSVANGISSSTDQPDDEGVAPSEPADPFSEGLELFDTTALKVAQQADPFCKAAIEFCKNPISLDSLSDKTIQADIKSVAQKLDFFKETLYVTTTRERRKRDAQDPPDPMLRLVVIPSTLRATVVKMAHGISWSGHIGYEKVLLRLRRRCWWPRMAKDVTLLVKACPQCPLLKSRRSRPAGEYEPIIATRLFEIVGFDVVGPVTMSNSGNRYIVTFIDYFSSWTAAKAVPEVTSADIAQALMDTWISQYSIPFRLISDQGSNLTSRVLTRLYKGLGIDKRRTTTYHPQANGKVERFHGTLAVILRDLIDDDQRNWDEKLSTALYAIRTFPQDNGISAYEIVFGNPPMLPLDTVLGIPACPPSTTVDNAVFRREFLRRHQEIHKKVRAHLEKTQGKRKIRGDLRFTKPTFKVGDRVCVRQTSRRKGLVQKFMKPYTGPWIIDKVLGAQTYRLRGPGGKLFKSGNAVRGDTLKYMYDQSPLTITHSSLLCSDLDFDEYAASLVKDRMIDSRNIAESSTTTTTTSTSTTSSASSNTTTSIPPTIISQSLRPPEISDDEISPSIQMESSTTQEPSTSLRRSSRPHRPNPRYIEMTSEPDTPSPYADILRDDEEYDVESILAHTIEDGGRKYFIKWLDYPESENSWEPEANLVVSEETRALLNAYKRLHSLDQYDERLNSNSNPRPRRGRKHPIRLRTDQS